MYNCLGLSFHSSMNLIVEGFKWPAGDSFVEFLPVELAGLPGAELDVLKAKDLLQDRRYDLKIVESAD